MNVTPSGVGIGGLPLPAGAMVPPGDSFTTIDAEAVLAAPAPTTMTEFLPPKPSSAVSFAVGSSFQVPPSITNLYR